MRRFRNRMLATLPLSLEPRALLMGEANADVDSEAPQSEGERTTAGEEADGNSLAFADEEADTNTDPNTEGMPSWVSKYGWTASFFDDFNGTQLDTNVWRTLYPWGSRTHNHRGIARDENLVVQDGNLTLIGGGADSVERGKKDRNFYPTGVVSLRQSIDVSDRSKDYSVVARMKLANRNGTWPAFWLNSQGGWPNINEIDIMEQQGWGAQNRYESVIHFANSGKGGGRSSQHRSVKNFSNSLDDTFNEFRVVFRKNVVELRFNDRIVNSVSGSQARHLRQAGKQGKYNLILNLAIGGDWGGGGFSGWVNDTDENGNYTKTSEFVIDYVGVFERPAQ